MKDHLGNTRLTFTTKPKTHEFTLNYEGNTNNPDDQGLFEKTGNITGANIHDHTDAGSTYTKSQKLTGADGSIIGSVLTIPVGKGDQINASVYAKYLAATTTSNPASSVAAALIGALSGNTTAANFEGAANSTTVSFGGSFIDALGDEVSNSEPKAFINLMFLAEQATQVGAFAYRQVSSSSNGAHAPLALDQDFEAPQAGYVVIYLSNESSLLTEVYFDDLQVTVNESKVIQTDDYYPFGLTFNSYKRSTGKENRFLYNGKEIQKELNINHYAYGARFYDPAISRFTTLDPKAETYNNWSPYLYAANNPIRYEDTNGEGPGDKVLGFLAAAVDNIFGGLTNVRSLAGQSVSPSGVADFNEGQDIGDVASILAGIAMVETGGGAATGGTVVLAGSGGTTTPVAGPVVAAGVAVAAEGVIVGASGANNFFNQKDRLKAEGNSSQGSGKGRGKNNRKPDSEATGDHSVSNDRGSTTFKKNPKNPNGFQEVKRVDTKGKSHGGIETPHVHEGGKVRPAQPNEIPKTDLIKNIK